MLVSIHQPHYLPWLPYLAKIARSDAFILLDVVDFTKNGWQNRNRIRTAAGPQLLTVPVRQRAGQKLYEVEIAGSSWRRKHWVSLCQHLAPTPCFAAYRAGLEPFYQRSWTSLVPLCSESLAWLLAQWGIRTPVVLASQLDVTTRGTRRLADLTRAVGGTAYLSGRFALRQYLEPHVLRDAGLELRLFDWNCPNYPQSSPGPFVPDLAGLDLLANRGPEGLQILLQGSAVS